ncbi:hypothetical protein [Novosphingobium soli]|uniref:DUF98 domain-containing protein n=1 Tax=Novosphingobium soli TaxID=574956 RepID=A0ABV6CU43_9SPHN
MASPALPAAVPPLPSPTLEAFESVLRRHDSATLALEEWCALRGLADPARITARTLPGGVVAPPPALPGRLALAEGEAIAMRNVSLSCGGTVLSVAWNWYVPARLTPAMNEALRVSDVPFGKVVAALDFRRRPLSTVEGPAENCPADTISTHRAMLVLPDGRPLAYLVECYTAANLAPRR